MKNIEQLVQYGWVPGILAAATFGPFMIGTAPSIFLSELPPQYGIESIYRVFPHFGSVFTLLVGIVLLWLAIPLTWLTMPLLGYDPFTDHYVKNWICMMWTAVIIGFTWVFLPKLILFWWKKHREKSHSARRQMDEETTPADDAQPLP